jgi:hypothetical protein
VSQAVIEILTVAVVGFLVGFAAAQRSQRRSQSAPWSSIKLMVRVEGAGIETCRFYPAVNGLPGSRRMDLVSADTVCLTARRDIPHPFVHILTLDGEVLHCAPVKCAPLRRGDVLRFAPTDLAIVVNRAGKNTHA